MSADTLAPSPDASEIHFVMTDSMNARCATNKLVASQDADISQRLVWTGLGGSMNVGLMMNWTNKGDNFIGPIYH